jgi:hypothetical protein
MMSDCWDGKSEVDIQSRSLRCFVESWPCRIVSIPDSTVGMWSLTASVSFLMALRDSLGCVSDVVSGHLSQSLHYRLLEFIQQPLHRTEPLLSIYER